MNITVAFLFCFCCYCWCESVQLFFSPASFFWKTEWFGFSAVIIQNMHSTSPQALFLYESCW